jgi:hypothetical protein
MPPDSSSFLNDMASDNSGDARGVYGGEVMRCTSLTTSIGSRTVRRAGDEARPDGKCHVDGSRRGFVECGTRGYGRGGFPFGSVALEYVSAFT